MVEDFNASANQATSGQQIQTARVELMLLDGFHLEETADWRGSVEFLMRRSKVMFDVHQVSQASACQDWVLFFFLRDEVLMATSSLHLDARSVGDTGQQGRPTDIPLYP